MTHQNQHQETAQKLITAYQGPEPLAAYLKKYFAANKKHGSKDRKSISAFCYAHFRDMHANFPLQEVISKEIDIPTFIHSHTIQPLLFIRIRPWQKEKVVAALMAASIEYTQVNEHCFAFSNTPPRAPALDKRRLIFEQFLDVDFDASCYKKESHAKHDFLIFVFLEL